MLENFVSIEIKKGVFEEKTKLNLFSSNNDIVKKISLIFGGNGSGKSTITKGFYNILDDSSESMNLLDKDGNKLNISEEFKNIIHIFNEDFIENNIRIDEEGLNSIVVMGSLKDIDEKIKLLELNLAENNEKKEKQREILGKYLDCKNILSPDYYINEMINSLKNNSCWSSRDSQLKGNKTNSKVKKNAYEQFINLKPNKERDELMEEYNKNYLYLEEARSGRKKIEENVPLLKEYMSVEKDIWNSLSEKIEKPKLSDREKNLIRILDELEGSKKLSNIKLYFSKSDSDVCPYCFQKVEKKYADELVSSIEKILNKKVITHQEYLKSLKMNTCEINLSVFKKEFPELVEQCENKIKELNTIIKDVNELIDKKIENPYIPISRVDLNLEITYEQCEKLLLELAREIDIYNNEIIDTKTILSKLEEINNEIAYHDIIDDYKKYVQQNQEKCKEERKLEEINNELHEIKTKINTLNAEKNSIHIAMNEINNDLKYIFFSENRLKISYENSKYVIYSHGKPVRPENISVGERNAIALCYYFNKIMENKNESEVYGKEYLLVIDDPISSFDMGNRIGILSYLKYKVGNFLKGNNKSKFILFTHDMHVFYDISHAFTELISVEEKIKENKAKKYINFLELKNKEIHSFDVGKRNEYSTLFKTIYRYALDGELEYSENIGNILRKVVEAFGTFLYKKGISQLSLDNEIMNKLSTEERNYYENLMYRLVLNTGSHLEEKVKTINDMNFFDFISDNEKQKTARDIICFMYKLNDLHVLFHLSELEEVQEVQKNITVWCTNRKL